MSTKQTNKPLALAVGAALVGGIALSGSAFAMTDLSSGYMLSASQAGSGAEQKAAEASCGANKKAAEAKCGADTKAAEAKCGADKKTAEGKCGEGKCGLDMMDSDKDGKVSSAEFAARHASDTSMFAKHDTNNDGFISADELKAQMEAKCGADKKAAGGKANMEGKCGEGKCGGMA